MCLPSKVKGATVQSIAVLVGNLLSLNFGLTFGVTPFHSRLYASEATPLNEEVTRSASTWVASCMFLSAALGSLAFGPISSKIGPKSVLLLSGLLQIAGWFCIHFAYDILHIYSSRIFAGVAAGAAFTVLPLYISEITECTRHNARMTVSIECWRNLGVAVGFAMATYLQYEIIPIVGLIVSIVFSMIFPFIQESPYYYIRSGNEPSFEKSMRWFRGIRSIEDRNNPDFERELREIKHHASKKSQTVSKDGGSPGSLAFFITSSVFAVGTQLSGTYVIVSYAPAILVSTGTLNLPIDIAILILPSIQLIGSVVAKWMSAIVSRRILLFVTSLSSGLCLSGATLYLSTGHEWNINDDLEPWILYALLVGHLLFASVGFSSFLTLILLENCPRKIQCRFLSVVHFITWIIVFVFIQFYQPLVQGISTTGLFLLFAVGCVSVTIWSLFPFAKTPVSKELQNDVTEGTVKNDKFTNLHI